MNDYTPLLIFTVTAFAISSIIVGASYLFSVKTPDAEKVSVYECGFDPFGDSRQKFEVRFFLVGILFIIFDLEISFLFPWSVAISDILAAHPPVGWGLHEAGAVGAPMEDSGYWVVILFLAILTIGLVYEWLKGGLEWE